MGRGPPRGGKPQLGRETATLLVALKATSSQCRCLVAQPCPTLQLHGLQPARLLCPWGFSRQKYGVRCHALLQRIFPTQGSNPGLLHCRRFFTI